MAAYAAAGLARADFMRTGLESVRLGWSAFVVPILFVLSPTLILRGEAGDIALAIVTALLGIWLVSIAVVGYFLRRVALPLRILYGAAGLLALIPAGAFQGAVFTDVIGAAVGGTLILAEFWIVRVRRGLRAAGSATLRY
jgi:TRAP-type uncharacterized transport system fused permease subunit